MTRLVCILAAVLLLCAFGCGQGTANTATEYGADYAQRVADAWKEKGFLDDMARFTDEDLLDYYGIDLAGCKSGVGYVDATGYTTEAIVVVAEEATAKEIETLLSDHLASAKETFRSYDPEALKIVENAVMLREGDLIVMIVSPDAQAMLETLRNVAP